MGLVRVSKIAEGVKPLICSKTSAPLEAVGDEEGDDAAGGAAHCQRQIDERPAALARRPARQAAGRVHECQALRVPVGDAVHQRQRDRPRVAPAGVFQLRF